MRAVVLVGAAVILAVVVGCGSSSSNPSCIVGASIACTCTDGRTGAQVCQADRTLAVCACTAGSGAGTGGNSGAGAGGLSGRAGTGPSGGSGGSAGGGPAGGSGGMAGAGVSGGSSGHGGIGGAAGTNGGAGSGGVSGNGGSAGNGGGGGGCPAGEFACTDAQGDLTACSNHSADTSNCGACGNRCQINEGEVCHAGQCFVPD